MKSWVPNTWAYMKKYFFLQLPEGKSCSWSLSWFLYHDTSDCLFVFPHWWDANFCTVRLPLALNSLVSIYAPGREALWEKVTWPSTQWPYPGFQPQLCVIRPETSRLTISALTMHPTIWAMPDWPFCIECQKRYCNSNSTLAWCC